MGKNRNYSSSNTGYSKVPQLPGNMNYKQGSKMGTRTEKFDIHTFQECSKLKLSRDTNNRVDLQELLYDFNIEDVIDNIQKLNLQKNGIRGNRSGAQNKSPVSKEIEDTLQLSEHLLRNNFNVCFYGVYSCYDTIDTLVNKYFSDNIQVRIKGFNTNIFLHNVLVKILQAVELFGEAALFQSTQKILSTRKPKVKETVDHIIKLLNKMAVYKEKLVIAFHNMDGRNFRELESQLYISMIANHSQVIFISSINNANYPNLISKQALTNFNFFWFQLNSLSPFKRELVYDEITWLNRRELKNQESLKMVFQSLTALQKQILALLAKTLIEGSKNYIDYYEFYELCQDGMHVSSEGQLKENLLEAIDHKILTEKTTETGNRTLSMPFSNDALKELADEYEDPQ